MRQSYKNGIRLAAFLLLSAGMLLGLNQLFLYRDLSVWSTDSRVERYEELPEGSVEVLFLGSSNLMCGINPLQLWEETGIQGYNYCSRAQTFVFAYEYLRQALETQTPACVVLDAFSVFSEKSYCGAANSEVHFGLNMDNLSLSRKLDVMELIPSYGDRLTYLFPLLKNHNAYKTWEETEDETGRIFMGYCFLDKVKEFAPPVYTDAATPMDGPDQEYLMRIIRLCQERGIDLFVIKTPVAYSDEQHRVLNHTKQVCEENAVAFYDMAADYGEWGFDYRTDLMDFSHPTSTGAKKITARLGGILEERYDFSGSPARRYAGVWEEENARMKAFLEENAGKSGEGAGGIYGEG